MTEGAPGAEGGAGDIVRDDHSAPVDDVDSSDDSLRERVLKVVADRVVRTSASQQEGEEGMNMGAPLTASKEVQAEPAGSSQIACAPSSSDAIPGIRIQVWRTRYFLLLEIDGCLMWKFFGHVGPLRDSLGLTIQKKMHYFLRPGLKRNVTPIIPENPIHLEELKQDLAWMRCEGLLDRSWALKREQMVREMLQTEGPNIFDGTIRDRP